MKILKISFLTTCFKGFIFFLLKPYSNIFFKSFIIHFDLTGDSVNDGDDTPEILLSPDDRDLYVEIPSDDNGTFHENKIM